MIAVAMTSVDNTFDQANDLTSKVNPARSCDLLLQGGALGRVVQIAILPFKSNKFDLI